MIDTDRLRTFCISESESAQAAMPDVLSDFDGGVTEGKVRALRGLLDEIESGRLDTLDAWVQLCKQDLKLIKERGGKIRRRGGTGVEFTIVRLYTAPDGQAILSYVHNPSRRLMVSTNEIVAEFEEVR